MCVNIDDAIKGSDKKKKNLGVKKFFGILAVAFAGALTALTMLTGLQNGAKSKLEV